MTATPADSTQGKVSPPVDSQEKHDVPKSVKVDEITAIQDSIGTC